MHYILFMKVSFRGIPLNYKKIDNTVSRSGQPLRADFQWLKDNGVTDIINFRTMYEPDVDFDEKTVTENLGMKYHNIPSYTNNPAPNNIEKFLDIVNEVKNRNGKVHIHCKAGADRTGMYSFIYKELNNIGDFTSNKIEMLQMGHNFERYPSLISWIKQFLISRTIRK